MSYLEDGIVEITDIQIPSEERFQKGPVAVIECVQEIPCNPCVESCPCGAIVIQGSINAIPKINFDRCNGCGMCIAHCPGLAIFLVNKNYDTKRALVGLPFEFLPLPEEGEIVNLMDRAGQVCAEGEVVRVRNTKAQDRTPVVFLAMDKDLAMEVRFFRRKVDEGKRGRGR